MINKPTILVVISLFLIGIWFILHFSKDDQPIYKTLTSQVVYYTNTTRMIKDGTDDLIKLAERSIEKSPDQQPILSMMRKIDTILNTFHEEIYEFETTFYRLTEGDFPFKKIYNLPIDYNKNQPVKSAIKAMKTSNSIKLNSKKIQNELEKTIFQQSNNLDLSDSVRNNFHQKQKDLLENVRVFSLLGKKKKWLIDLQKQDVVHTKLRLVALRNELTSLKYYLLTNTFNLIQEGRKKIKSHYIIEMLTDGQPIVNKPFRMDFYINAYAETESLEIKLNGKKMRQKNGIVTFNYTPKTAGMKYFDLEISVVNPFTKEVDRFKKQEIIYVN